LVGTVRYPRIVAKDEDSAKLLKKRTLTNLYNERPTWLHPPEWTRTEVLEFPASTPTGNRLEFRRQPASSRANPPLAHAG
jgi:hypothetical protein